MDSSAGCGPAKTIVESPAQAVLGEWCGEDSIETDAIEAVQRGEKIRRSFFQTTARGQCFNSRETVTVTRSELQQSHSRTNRG